MPLSQGQILNNRYRIVKPLGEGGFGAVYRAWDMNMECARAVKENLYFSPETQQQFKREAKLLGDLVHPNLPRVIDYFIIPGQGQYLVMDLVEGKDLQQMMDSTGGALPLYQVLAWIDQICDALVYMHSQHPPVIHRDIKPANIKITPSGKAMLVDFGIAKTYYPGISTTAGARAVTHGYSPPEQYGTGITDQQSDLYSLAATTYAALSGCAPPPAMSVISGVLPPIPEITELNPAIPAEISRVIRAAMHMNRGERTSSVGEFRADLAKSSDRNEALAPTEPLSAVTAPVVQPPEKAEMSRPAVRKKWIFWAGGFLMMVLLLAVALVIKNASQQDVVPESTTATTLPAPTWDAFPAVDPLPQVIYSKSSLMALVPAGDFIMGGSADRAVEECQKFISTCDRTTFEDEEPAHSVYLSDYYIDVYQVTNAQYADCVDEGACEVPGCTYYSDSEYSSYPVVCASWYQAQAYCEWRGARLPTEAEWEKAARGGLEGMQYPWGDEMPVCDTGAENGAQFGLCGGYIVPVGSYSPNGYGLYDMAGNVWEWVGDWYEAKFYHHSQAKDPQGPELGEMKVLRGGSWGFNAWSVRTPDRFWSSPDYRFLTIGFRCADSIRD